MNLLVIDFDFFFPNPIECCPEHTGLSAPLLYDWKHGESKLLTSNWIWTTRASGFLRHNLELPSLSGEQEEFWLRFAFTPRARLFYADSNSWAGGYKVARDVTNVWLFDAHHDSGYKGPTISYMSLYEQKVSCEDWMLVHELQGAQLHVRYPAWKQCAFESDMTPAISPTKLDRQFDNSEEQLPVFDRVFVCRSGAWVPAWHDDEFTQFIQRSPVKRRTNLDGIAPRGFTLEEANEDANKILNHIRASTLMQELMLQGVPQDEAAVRAYGKFFSTAVEEGV